MGEKGNVILYVGAYEERAGAVADFQSIGNLRHIGQIGDFEAAVFEKNADGDVRILDTAATERSFGAKAGAATGAIIGLIFPPALLTTALAGAGVGALAGHFMRGLKRNDIAALGETLDECQWGVVIIGFSQIDEKGQSLLTNARTTRHFVATESADEMIEILETVEAAQE